MTNPSTSRNGTSTTAPAQPPLALAAWRAVEAILRHTQTALAHIDLTQPQWWALNNVARAEHGLTREEIRAVNVPYGMGTEVIAHASDALVHRGWLAAGTDGRLTLTDQGRAGLATAKEHMARGRVELVGDITEEEYATAVSVLRRVTDNLA
ncbi:MarR family winged helix-turn-helix transcriptional regulator [Streptomyces huiliensis]|uniref:MarR family winged helix-turn-helix transcriptional regulator n=1 Tax=Streptomyces huiliensis TaxID=2876027 RepID=UPI001CBD1907|nr:MarR family winged helix-turn-helix transcriptional regulator [Streptomyces huiliensis]MBZ4318612.1 MarR family winged helix-turn-helix transcriptional regulator [Streptomyces huiliensis]